MAKKDVTADAMLDALSSVGNCARDLERMLAMRNEAILDSSHLELIGNASRALTGFQVALDSSAPRLVGENAWQLKKGAQ